MTVPVPSVAPEQVSHTSGNTHVEDADIVALSSKLQAVAFMHPAHDVYSQDPSLIEAVSS